MHRIGAAALVLVVTLAALAGSPGQASTATEEPVDERLDGACPANLPPAGFADVDGGPHARAVDCVAWWEVTRGDGSGRYQPGADIRRDQLASMLARLLDAVGHSADPAAGQGFDDVEGSVHAGNVNALAAMGVIHGLTPTRFGPARPVRRDQMASLLVRLHEALFAALPTGQSTFDDVGDNVHAPAIAKLAAADITGGVTASAYSRGDKRRVHPARPGRGFRGLRRRVQGHARCCGGPRGRPADGDSDVSCCPTVRSG